MILEGVLDSVKSYTGTDISNAALSRISTKYKMDERSKKIKQLHYCQSIDVENIIQEVTPDVIVINSVIQYFPSVEYLFNTIMSSVRVLLKSNDNSKNAIIFVGDVKNYATLYDFHLAIHNDNNTNIQEYLKAKK